MRDIQVGPRVGGGIRGHCWQLQFGTYTDSTGQGMQEIYKQSDWHYNVNYSFLWLRRTRNRIQDIGLRR